MENTLNGLKDTIKDALKKIQAKGDLTPAELENAIKAVELIDKICEVEIKLNCEKSGMDYGLDHGYGYGYGYDRGTPIGNMMSGERGRSPVTGRYISRGTDTSMGPNSGYNGYSGHSIQDRMVASLEGMYDTAKTEHERAMVDEWIKRIRNGNM